MVTHAGRRPWVLAVAVLTVVGIDLAHGLRAWARAGPIRKELLQSKIGPEYGVAILRLWARDPAQDARDDLAAGDRALYMVGTFAPYYPGIEDVPDGMAGHGTATIGCVVDGGTLGMVYRQEEERYLAAYNEAKVAAAGSGPG